MKGIYRPASRYNVAPVEAGGPRGRTQRGRPDSRKTIGPARDAVANAQVSLVAENGKQVQTTAGSDGQFAFKGVSRGKYS